MGILLTEIYVPTSLGRPQSIYRPEEILLKDSYIEHQKSALILAKNANFWSAKNSLITSIECFLKHFFCYVRFTVWSDFRPQTAHGEIYKFHQFEKVFQAKDFGHKIRILANFLTEIIPELSGGDFDSLTLNLPSDETWINDRYNFRQSHAAYQIDYQNLLAAFQKTLNGDLIQWK